MSQTEPVAVVETGAAVLTGHRVVRVNLLPPQIAQARRLRRVQAGLAAGMLIVVGGVAGLYVLHVGAKADVEQDLAAAQAQTRTLQAEQQKFADVPRTLAEIDALTTARQTAMATDVEWSRSLNNFAVTLPPSVWFDTLTLTTASGGAAAAPAPSQSSGGAAAGGAQPAAPAAPAAPGATVPGAGAPAAVGLGLVTVTGYAKSHPDVAKWLDVLAKQPGMADAYFTNSTKEKRGQTEIVKFSSTATLTSEALSRRYDRKQG
ncbi:MAG: PilN domain-containing protein [Angustibacter sp.]